MWTSVLTDDVIASYTQYIQETDRQIDSFLSIKIDKELSSDAQDSLLRGLPFAVKDNIAVKGLSLSCASRMLEPLISPYTATAVQSLLSAGAQVVGKTNLDEFGMGSSSHNSAFKKTKNPWDQERVAGGSSGGSAAAVSAGMVPLALGSDTGGSVRQPASFCGVYGLKPGYGTVSRYGLVAYASSLDVIGVLAESVDLLEASFTCIAGKDEHDQTSLPYVPEEPSSKPMRIGVCPDYVQDCDAAIQQGYRDAMEVLRSQGHQIVDCDLPKPEHGLIAYYIIATAEASANLARFDGIRYGHQSLSHNTDELVRTSRSEGFGEEVKLRILLGTYVLRSGFYDQYYSKAQRVRNMVQHSYRQIFKSIDALLLPVFPTQAFRPDEMDAFQQRIGDRFTVPANLTGMPSIAFPLENANGLPLGMQLMGPQHSEARLCSIVRSIAKEMQRPPGFPAAMVACQQGAK